MIPFAHLTDAVPEKTVPLPRPANEMLIDLPSGHKMPATGMGMCCRATAYHPESVRRSVLWFLLQGGRLIDTAELYMNHKSVGEGVRDAVARGVPRSEIFVTTKIPPELYGYNSTVAWTKRMLKEIGLDYVDLVLLHHPRPMIGQFFASPEKDFNSFPCRSGPNCRAETWRALAEARKKGQIKELGVSNFGKRHFEELKASGLLKDAPIAVNQLPYNPWVPEWEKDIVKYCQANGIALTGYFSLGGGHSTGSTLTWDALSDMAKKHKKSAAQVLFRWSLQHGVAVIPGTGNPKHMRDNINLFDFSLTDAEMAKIDTLAAEKVLAWTPDFMNPDRE